MRIILLLGVIVMGSADTQAQSPTHRPIHIQPALHCERIAANVTQMAAEGFRVLNSQESCAAVPVLENTYRTLDSGRQRCGSGWAQTQTMLEMDLLEALDYAGETCEQR